jgi:hypothetical protein
MLYAPDIVNELVHGRIAGFCEGFATAASPFGEVELLMNSRKTERGAISFCYRSAARASPVALLGRLLEYDGSIDYTKVDFAVRSLRPNALEYP